MSAPVPQAAVDAAMKEMHCKRAWQGTYCSTHNLSTEWTEQGCGYAVEVAAAVVAAVQGPIKAEAWDEGYAAGRQDVQGSVYAGRKVVRDNPYRADRIEAQ